jgi:hypothetical protein
MRSKLMPLPGGPARARDVREKRRSWPPRPRTTAGPVVFPVPAPDAILRALAALRGGGVT